MTWDPGQYFRFDDLRSRPALDLINRIPEIEYAASLRHHYPRRGDGTMLFAFRRIFIVATR